MKKVLSIVVVCFMLFVVVGCGGSKTEGNKTDPGKPAEVTGTLFETSFMSFRHSDEWRVTEDTNWKTINCEKGSALTPTHYVLIKSAKDSFATAEQAVSDFAQKYNGSPAEKVSYNNIEYYQTSFEYGGTSQTMLVTMVGEEKVTITLQGAGHQDDQSIKDILNSIELKF
jgi:hypothetical protein